MAIPEPVMTIAGVLFVLPGIVISMLIVYARIRMPNFPLGLLFFPLASLLLGLPTAWRGVFNRLRYPVISNSGLTWHRGWRGLLDWLRLPFSRVTIRLNSAELDSLFGSSADMNSGLKSVIRGIQRKTDRGTGELTLSARDARRIRRIAFAPTKRPAQQRVAAEFLRQVLERSLGERLDGFTDLFRTSNGVPKVPKVLAHCRAAR